MMLFVRKCNIFEEESTPKPNHQWGVSRSNMCEYELTTNLHKYNIVELP